MLINITSNQQSKCFVPSIKNRSYELKEFRKYKLFSKLFFYFAGIILEKFVYTHLMILTILAIGKKKTEYDGMIAEYQKRIVAPFSLSFEILEPLGIDHPEQCRIKESEKLLAKIKPGDFVIALDETGKEFTTVEFSKLLELKLHDGIKRVVLVIGGAYGLSNEFKKQVGFSLRLGAMTMPHELARLVITEQLYRVTNIISGGKYHHV